MLSRSTTSKRNPTSPLQSDEQKKSRSWSQVVSVEPSVDTVSESEPTNTVVAEPGDMDVMSTQGACHTVTLNQDSITAIVQMVSAAMEPKLASIVNDSVQNVIALMNADLEEVKKVNVDLQQQNDKLTRTVLNLQTQMDDIEQYSRRNCLRVAGIKEDASENTDTVILKLAGDMGVNLTLADIDRSHRVGRPGNPSGRPRHIIVKFTTYRARAAIYRNRRTMMANPLLNNIYVNEDLTAYRSELLFRARQAVKQKQLLGAWSYDGRLYVRDKRDIRRNLDSDGDLDLYIDRAT